MKFSIRTLLGILLLTGIIASIVASRYSPIKLKLGMDQAHVENLLRRSGAHDISDSMSTYTVIIPYDDETTPTAPPEPEFNPTGMWHLDSINLTIETEFTEEKLDKINVWDWSGREMDRYHHCLEYDSVSELTIPLMHASYRCNVLTTKNKGTNPPAHLSRTPQQ